MSIKEIFMVIAVFGILFWVLRRRHEHYPTAAGQDSGASSDQPGSKGELDEGQAAEVVTTWTLLNPPS